MKKQMTLLIISLTLLLAGVSCQTASGPVGNEIPKPKNIIYFVSDGMGFNHLLATNFYQYGESDMQVYEQADWLHLAQATNNLGYISDGDTIYTNGYSPRSAWMDADYLMQDYTDSGAAATALSTGEKTLSAHLGISFYGDTLMHISQAAKALGKSIGVVSSVPLSHATPAGFVAHNSSRHNYGEIANYMFFHTKLDVIMAPGHPLYNDNGEVAEASYRYVGSPVIWDQLAANDGLTELKDDDQVFYVQDVNGDGVLDPWTFIEDREDFIALASGPVPKRVLGVPKVRSTLHQGRQREEMAEIPFEQPLNENVPRLEELTRASLNVLGQNSEGFFVMVEGGAVDWASHDNHLGRMIEEQIDFNNSVSAAVEWVEANSSWDETLIIVTSDHECGYLTGPGHPDPVNDPVVNNGKGILPEAKWNFSSHTNVLVPFYAKGLGSAVFTNFAGENDPVRGPYLHNTDIANAIFMMWGKPDIETHRLTN
jgi:alkaline phosphatase